MYYLQTIHFSILRLYRGREMMTIIVPIRLLCPLLFRRFLDNGVWDMVAVNQKLIITTFVCCDTPTYDVQYRLLFKRRPNFYIKNLIIPVILLSTLSTFVFYLPPESGEKVTLSITNLLALVVFEQTISATMPPSGGNSPVIGMSFFIIIET